MTRNVRTCRECGAEERTKVDKGRTLSTLSPEGVCLSCVLRAAVPKTVPDGAAPVSEFARLRAELAENRAALADCSPEIES